MIGLFWAFATAVLGAVGGLLEKGVLNKEHASEFVSAFAMLNFLICLPLLFFVDFTQIGLINVLGPAINAFVGGIAFYLISISVRHSEVSSISPFIVLGPGVTSVVAFFVLGEALSLQQWMGIGVLILGAFFLEHKGRKSSAIVAGLKSKYIVFILGALLLYAITSVIDKIMVTTAGTSPVAYIVMIHFFSAIYFFLFVSVKYSPTVMVQGIMQAKYVLILACMATIGYRFTYLLALQDLEVGIVSAIKRLASLFILLVGGKMYHETHIYKKAFACSAMLIGVALLVI